MSAAAQATFCATLVDQWIALGVRHAVIAPGSRSTPMALAIADRTELAVHVVHDERSAAFVALGIGVAASDGAPALLLCTSGTAATHFHAAVVEAGLSNVAMIVLTADRPPELRDVGASQTIDQTKLYGSAVRWFHDPGVAAQETSGSWRALAAQTVVVATRTDPGPVHLNLPFREPLVADPEALGVPAIDRVVRPRLTADIDGIGDAIVGRRGVIIAGRGVDDAAAVARLAAAIGWPVLADPRSGCRYLTSAIGAFDALLRVESFGAEHRPDVVLRLGEPPASKVLAQWLVGSGAVHIQIDDSTRVMDPDHVAPLRICGRVGATCAAIEHHVMARPEPRRSADDADHQLASWTAAERLAQSAITAALGDALTEPAVARVLTGPSMRAGTHLVVASSMPIRDVEWFGDRCADITVHANRGANGIDGVIATAIGVAIETGAPTVALLGDVAFCHDASSLTALATRRLDLTIVVIDNDGGGIFSFLPQAEALPSERFEQLFGTPHGTDLLALAQAHGLAVSEATSVADLTAAIARPGTHVVRIRSDRRANVDEHRRLNDVVAAALQRAATGG